MHLSRFVSGGLGLLLLGGAARAGDAKRQLIIWGGGESTWEAIDSLRDFHLAVVEKRRGGWGITPGAGFPMLMESARIPGLNPGFEIVALGLCPEEQASALVKTFRKELGEPEVYARPVDWAPQGSGDEDLCPRVERGREAPGGAAPRRDCPRPDPSLCLVGGEQSGSIHMEWSTSDGILSTPELPLPLACVPRGVVGSDKWSFDRGFNLRTDPSWRGLEFTDHLAFDDQGMTEGGENALVKSWHYGIDHTGRRIVARSLYAYVIDLPASCNENIDFATRSYDSKCQRDRDYKTVRREGSDSAGEDGTDSIPVGKIANQGKLIVATGPQDPAPEWTGLTILKGPPPLGMAPRVAVRWEPTRLSFNVHITDRQTELGPKPENGHFEIWVARESITRSSLLQEATEGVRHLVIDFSGDQPRLTLAYPKSKRGARAKPIPGTATRALFGHRVQFDLDYSDLIGAPRRLKGERKGRERFYKNEILLFTLVVVDGDGVKPIRTSASSPLRPGVPATFGRLMLSGPERLPELSSAMFGLD